MESKLKDTVSPPLVFHYNHWSSETGVFFTNWSWNSTHHYNDDGYHNDIGTVIAQFPVGFVNSGFKSQSPHSHKRRQKTQRNSEKLRRLLQYSDDSLCERNWTNCTTAASYLQHTEIDTIISICSKYYTITARLRKGPPLEKTSIKSLGLELM